jgi:DNA repair protein RecN (Recombination protein N)
VNSQAMPVQALRQLGETLVDIHGQMEYQSLTRRAAQRELLDQSGDYRELLAAVGDQHRAWAELREQRDRAAASAQDREARLELLRYHLGELSALDLKGSEIEELTAERQRLSQHGRLAAGAREILQMLREAEDMNAEQAVSRALTVSRSLTELDARFASIAKAIDESLIALREGIESAERYEADLEADPQRQEWVEQRLAAIEAIARKHRVEPAALGTLQAELAAEFQQLDTLEASLEQIEQKLTQLQTQFRAACTRLTAARTAAVRSTVLPRLR